MTHRRDERGGRTLALSKLAPSQLAISKAALGGVAVLVAALGGCGAAPGTAGPTVVVGPAPSATGTAAADEPKDPNFHCEGTRIEAGKHTYCAYTTPRTWQSARQVCKSDGGDLAAFNDVNEAHDIFVAMGPPIGAAEAVWFGLQEPTPGKWTWLSGAALVDTSWNKGEPNNDGGREDCGEWRLADGTWNDAPCDSMRRFVCGLPASDPGAATMKCSGQRIHTAEGEYCFHMGSRKSWSTAKAACEAEGTKLASLPTKKQNDLLLEAVGPKVKTASLWIGLTDRDSKYQWVWVTTEYPRDPRWKYGEPNDYLGHEDCGEWFPADGELNDLDCKTQRPFLCENARPGPDKVIPKDDPVLDGPGYDKYEE
ncbi:MAG: lectin-like protein [Polyangiaceae bacterium]